MIFDKNFSKPYNYNMDYGKLYICPTPIGNLKDITVRVLETLSNVELILAEDTRVTKKLLNHFNIKTPVISFYSYNETIRIPQIIDYLKQGKNIALVSDSGTPCISDPGMTLVQALIKNNIKFFVLPGPVAFVPALIYSGFDINAFCFEGFLSSSDKKRRRQLKRLVNEHRAIVIYVSPHKLLKTLKDMLQIMGNRNISISRELTKVFEENWQGTIKDAIIKYETEPIKGEFVLVIEGKDS